MLTRHTSLQSFTIWGNPGVSGIHADARACAVSISWEEVGYRLILHRHRPGHRPLPSRSQTLAEALARTVAATSELHSYDITVYHVDGEARIAEVTEPSDAVQLFTART